MRPSGSLLLLAGSASAAFQLPFLNQLWPSSPQTKLEIGDSSQSSRIAIIGAGAGGSSAAFWIAKAKERYGLDVEVDIYDRNSYIGGRSTTVYPYNDSSYEPVELGASIFVEINRNLWRASNEFNFSRYGFEDEQSELGLWNGESFVFTQGSTGGTIGSWLDSLKALWRYGYFAPTNALKLVRRMTDKFVLLYTPETPHWENITNIIDVFNWDELVSQTGAEYFTSNGVSKLFTNELIEAATRVNYAQDVDSIHALEAAASLATTGAATLKGGNWKIFEKFVELSGAQVFLDTVVQSIDRKSSSQWTVQSDKGAIDYRAVILAAPYHTSDITLPSDLSSLIPKQPYIHLHVTLLTTSAPTPNAEYFGLTKGEKAPTTILTTLDGVRNGGRAPEFNSLNYLTSLSLSEEVTQKDEESQGHNDTQQDEAAHNSTVSVEDAAAKDEWVVKIFSMAPVSDEWLAHMFQGQVGWVLRKEWDSYPVLPPTTTFPSIKLDRGLFYVNAFEPFISTMETETIASRNIVDWLLKEEYDASICAPSKSTDNSTESTPLHDENFVYGWDC